MRLETELRCFSDSFFFSELLSLFDAHKLAADHIAGYCRIPEFSDLACGLAKFYSWMRDRQHRQIDENILGPIQAAEEHLGLSSIDRFLRKEISQLIAGNAANCSPDEIENRFILASWVRITATLTTAMGDFARSSWEQASVKQCSLLSSDPRTQQGWSPSDYLKARLSRCTKHPTRVPFWENIPLGDQTILQHPLNFYMGVPILFQERSSWIKILCGLVAKYHILQHYSRHTSESINPEFHKRIYAVFTFIKAFAAYYPHYLNAGDLKLSILFRCHSHLRRGATKFYQGADHFYQMQFPQAFSMAFNEYERATEFAKSGVASSLVDTSLSNVYTHLIPIICAFFKGELYRQDCSYSNAREYYYEGARSCEQLLSAHESAKAPSAVEKNSQDVLRTSYARTKALANLGKNYFELGEFRRALKWLFRALASLPEISQSEHQAIVDQIGKVSELLHDSKNEPLISKNDRRLILYLTNIRITIHTALLGEADQNAKTYPLCSRILNTIALILYQMRFVTDENIKPELSPDLKTPLAFDWLCLAIKLDRNNAQAFHNANLFQRNWRYHFNADPHSNFPDDLKECLKKRPASVVIESYESDRDLSPMDRWNRQISANVLGQMEPGRKPESDILAAFFAHTDNFSRKNFELLRYLCRDRTIDDLENDTNAIYLKTLRRWSSFTPSLPRPASLSKRGGGYFLITKVIEKGKCRRKGIVIDPGFDFVRNLYIEGHSLQDIDAIMVTHNHIDHTADIDPCLSLIWYLHSLIEKKPIDLFLSQGVAQRYAFYLRESGKEHEIVQKLRVLAPDSVQDFSDEYGFKVTTLKTNHKELGAVECGLGLVMDFYDGKEEPQLSIGYTGDTHRSVLENSTWIQTLKRCHVVIANIGTVPFPELMALSPTGDLGSESVRLVWNLITRVLNIQPIDDDLPDATISQLKPILWSLWFNPEDDMLKKPTEKEKGMGICHWHKIFILTCLLFGKYPKENPELFIEYLEKVDEIRGKGILLSEKSDDRKKEYRQYLLDTHRELTPTGDHLFLEGITAILERLSGQGKINALIISEFREELGSFRRLIADYINKGFAMSKLKTHTADTDLSMRLVLGETNQPPSVNIRCSLCKLNNDCLPGDAYHNHKQIREVCVKGEDDAMYYFCPRHTPGYANQYFMEKLACYKPFEREFRY